MYIIICHVFIISSLVPLNCKRRERQKGRKLMITVSQDAKKNPDSDS